MVAASGQTISGNENGALPQFPATRSSACTRPIRSASNCRSTGSSRTFLTSATIRPAPCTTPRVSQCGAVPDRPADLRAREALRRLCRSEIYDCDARRACRASEDEADGHAGFGFSPVGLFLRAGLVGKAVMAVLFLASLWCWVLIVEGVVSVVAACAARCAPRAPGARSRSAARRRRRRGRGGGPPAHSRRDGERGAGADRRRHGAGGARTPHPRRGRPAQSRGHFLGRAVRRPVRHGLGHHVELRRDLQATTRASPPSRPASPSRLPRPPTASPRRSPPRSATTASAPPSPASARRWPPSSRSARSRSSPARPRSRGGEPAPPQRRRPDGDAARARSAKASTSRWPRSTSRRSST